MSRKLALSLVGGTAVATTIIVPTVLLTTGGDDQSATKDTAETLKNDWNALSKTGSLAIEGLSNVSADKIKNWEDFVKCINATDNSSNTELKAFIKKATEENKASFEGSSFTLAENGSSIKVTLKITLDNQSFTTEPINLTGFKAIPNPEPIKVKVDIKQVNDAETKLAGLKTVSGTKTNVEFIEWLNDRTNKESVKPLFEFSANNGQDIVDLEIDFHVRLSANQKNADFKFSTTDQNLILSHTNFSIKLPKDQIVPPKPEKTTISISTVVDAKSKLSQLKTLSGAKTNLEFIEWLNNTSNTENIKSLFEFSADNNQDITNLRINFSVNLSADKKSAIFNLSSTNKDFILSNNILGIELPLDEVKPEPIPPKPEPVINPQSIVEELNKLVTNEFNVSNNLELNNSNFFNENTNPFDFLFAEKTSEKTRGILTNDTSAFPLKAVLEKAIKNHITLTLNDPQIIHSNNQIDDISFKIKVSLDSANSISREFRIKGFKGIAKIIWEEINNLINHNNFTINLVDNPTGKSLFNGLDAYYLLLEANNDSSSFPINSTKKALFGEGFKKGILTDLISANQSSSAYAKKIEEILQRAQANGISVKIKLKNKLLPNLYSSVNNKIGSANLKFQVSYVQNPQNWNPLESTNNLKINNFKAIDSNDIVNRIDNLISHAQKNANTNHNPYGNTKDKAELKSRNGVYRGTLAWISGVLVSNPDQNHGGGTNAYDALFGSSTESLGVLPQPKPNTPDDPLNLAIDLKKIMEEHSKFYKYTFGDKLNWKSSGADSQKAWFNLRVMSVGDTLNISNDSTSGKSILIIKNFDKNAQSIAYEIQSVLSSAQKWVPSGSGAGNSDDVYNVDKDFKPGYDKNIDLIIQPVENAQFKNKYTNWGNETKTNKGTDAYKSLFIKSNKNDTYANLPDGVLLPVIDNKRTDPFSVASKLKNIMETNSKDYRFVFAEGVYGNESEPSIANQIREYFWGKKENVYKKGVWFKIKVIRKNPVQNDFEPTGITEGKITLVMDKNEITN